MTFNRRGKTSTEAHMRRGWEYRTLPLHIRPLSTKPLVEEHAGEVLPDVPSVEPAAAVAGGVASTALPDWAVARSVEFVTSGRMTRPLTPYGHASDTSHGVDVRPYEPDDLDAVIRLFDTEIARFDLAFAREKKHVEHMVGYDHAEAVVAVSDGDIVGFACVGLLDQGDQVEARLFDLIDTTDAVGDRLLEWTVATARKRGADVVSMLREERPGPRWASLRTDLVMWKYLQNRDEWHQRLSDGEWRITAYDVL